MPLRERADPTSRPDPGPAQGRGDQPVAQSQLSAERRQARAPDQEGVRTALDCEARDRLRSHLSARAVGGFEESDLEAGLLEAMGGHQAGDPTTDHRDIKRRRGHQLARGASLRPDFAW